MSEKSTSENAQAAADQAAAEGAAAPAADAAAKNTSGRGRAQKGAFTRYVSTQKHTIPFDIMIKGETLMGSWTRETGIVMFDVPSHLVEGFEKHHHFVTGNVKRED